MSDTGALLRFVQRPNAASLEEGRAALQAAGRYSELVALYQPRGQHQAALSLLRTLSQVPGSCQVSLSAEDVCKESGYHTRWEYVLRTLSQVPCSCET